MATLRTLTVKVTTGGAPLADALVVVNNLPKVTGATGAVTFRLASGTAYPVRVCALGYQPQRLSVTLSAALTLPVALEPLVVAPPPVDPPPTDPLPSGAIILNPGDSIQAVIDSHEFVSGLTIALRAGTYNQRVRLSNTPYLTLRNYPGETAVIQYEMTGPGDQNSALTFHWHSPNSHVYGLEITGGYYAVKIDGGEGGDAHMNDGATVENCSLHGTWADVVKVTPNADRVTIKENEIYDSGHGDANAQGIDAVGDDDLLISGNYVHDTVSDGITVKGGSQRAIIENNRVIDSRSNGIDAGMAATDWSVFDLTENPNMYECIDCTIRNNTITNVVYSGICIYGSRNTRVEGNSISGFGSAGLRIAAIENWPKGGARISTPSLNVTVVGNTFTSTSASAYGVRIINCDLGIGLTGTYVGSGNVFIGTMLFGDDTGNYVSLIPK